jgi:hypothetical protein
MKIETRDMVPTPDPEPEMESELDPGLVRRAVLAMMLASILVVTLWWAVNVTNANARQISSNLSSMSDRIDGSWPDAQSTRRGRANLHAVRAAKGPTIEPADRP